MARRLEGKVAVVTGAGSGIGRAVAMTFAAEGAKVVGADVAREGLEAVAHEVERAGGTMVPVVADVSQRADVDAMMAAAIEGQGGLDVLVNNAGVLDSFQGAATLDDDTYARVMAVNVYGPMAATRVAVRTMKERGGGSIVNIGSVAGRGGGAAGAAYTASKHALVGLTKNTAITYAGSGIRCNVILCGGVETNIQASMDQAKIDQEALGRYGKWHALAVAMLQPEDIAAIALFLASDEAKGVNGASVAADAGWSAY